MRLAKQLGALNGSYCDCAASENWGRNRGGRVSTPVVFIDTTATAKDVLLESTAWRQLLALCKRGVIRLVIPEVVVLETARHWAREVEANLDLGKSLQRIQDRVDRLQRLGVEVAVELPAAPEGIVVDGEAFAEKLRERLRSLGVTVAPLPRTSIADLLARDLSVRRPFQGSGKGFRDALIWETICEVIADEGEAPSAYLVTNNTTDYYDGDKLHPHLAADISADSSPVMAASVQALLQSEPFASLVESLQVSAPDERLRSHLKDGSEPAEGDAYISVAEYVTTAVVAALEELQNDDIETNNSASWGLDFTALNVSPYLESPHITNIEPTSEGLVDWHAYETFDETTLLIQASIEVEVEIEGSVHRSEYVDAEEDGVSVWGFDPDEHYCDGYVTVEARAVYQVRVEAGVGVVDIELEGFEPV